MKIKRLFWKIFAAFWLVSLAIMLATSYAIITSVETEKFRIQYEKAIKSLSKRAITHYEGLSSDKPMRKSVLRRFGPPHNLANHRHIIRIQRDNKVIFERSPGKQERETLTFNITSKADNLYTVEALTPRPPRHLTNMLQKVNTVQFFIILFASTLVSFLLSWSITRPLKKLGIASRQFAQGDLHTQVDIPLLSRADEIGDLAHDLAFMMRKIQQTISAQKQLLHDVSHELRTPLNSILILAKLISENRDNNLTRKQVEFAEVIHNSGNDLLKLINEVLDLTKIEAGKLSLEVMDFDPRQLDLKPVFQEIAKEKNILFEVSYDENLPETISSDKFRIEQVLKNLLSNAFKFTEEGTVSIEVRELKNKGPISTVEIAVIDTGIGISRCPRAQKCCKV